MSYFVAVRVGSGKIVMRHAENMINLPDVIDDGETVCVLHHDDDYPITADDCNTARAWRAYWRKAYAAAGAKYLG